jgi:hypothetical protein
VAGQQGEEAVDSSEDKKGRSLQAKVQSARVRLIRAAGRLGLRYDSGIVSQFLGVINRVEEAQVGGWSCHSPGGCQDGK